MNRLKFYVLKTTVIGALIATFTATQVMAEYPEKRIDLIVPWSAGGSSDARARVISSKLAEVLDTPVVVKNVAGAGGTIGTNQVAQSRPDGYTILSTASGPLMVQPLIRKIPYSIENFDIVCRFDLVPLVFMVSQDSPYKTLQSFIDAAKANPGQISYSSAGVGSFPHILSVGLEVDSGIKLKHLPTKGSANAMKNLLGNVVDAAPETLDHVARFDVRPLAVASDERQKKYPDIPTFKESGVDLSLSNWQALYIPKGTPVEVKQKLASACEEVFSSDDVKKSFTTMNSTVSVLTGKEVDAFGASQAETFKLLLKSSGMTK
jgi:tripartite-type tricarboxylate transporter receptor subunit TctC